MIATSKTLQPKTASVTSLLQAGINSSAGVKHKAPACVDYWIQLTKAHQCTFSSDLSLSAVARPGL